MLERMKQYLSSALSIPSEQKRYTMNFCKKINYLNELHAVAIQDTNEYVCTGFGNVNSKICFVFKDKEVYEIVRPLIQETLDKFHINAWDVYVTFVNKTKSEYSKKYSFLVNELHAINPSLMYIYDNDEVMYDEILEEFQKRNIALPSKHFLVDIQQLGSVEIEVRKALWNIFKYLINYKEIEQED